MSIRKTILWQYLPLIVLVFFNVSRSALASFAPGTTLDPGCAPTDPGCDISPTTLVSNGGTNITAYTIGDILYASGTTTLTKLPISSDGRVLKIAGGIPSWGIDAGGTNFLASETGLHLNNLTNTFSLVLDGASLAQSVLGVKISPTYLGQSSITTLGTITAGHWSGDQIDTSEGGTGINSYNLGDVLYGSVSSTLAKLPAGAENSVLKISGGLPSWGTDTVGPSYLASEQGLHLSTSTNTFLVALDGSSLTQSSSGLRLSPTYTGQSSLTTVGTITAGLWHGNTIDAHSGGTGQTTYTLGDLLYASGPNALSKIPIGPADTILKVAGGIPSWQTDAVGPTYLASEQGLHLSTSTNTFLVALDGSSLAQSASGLRLASSYTGQNSINTVGTVTSGHWSGDPITVNNGGTGLITTPAAGQLLIGDGTGYTLGNITGSEGVTITNSPGNVNISLSVGTTPTITSPVSNDYLPIYASGTLLRKKISYADLFAGVLGSLNYQGVWNANTNTPTLANGDCATSSKGRYFVIGNSGTTTLGGVSVWGNGDWAVCNGTTWEKTNNTDSVASVFGRTGIISAQAADYNALQITNIPAGTLTAVTVQGALNELDTKKEPTVATGTLTQYWRGDKTWRQLNTANVTEDPSAPYFTNARSRAALNSNALGLSYDNITGTFSLSSGYLIPLVASSTNWNTAYSWGNHASAGYLTGLSGDGTTAGSGLAGLTLATVNTNVGTFGAPMNAVSFTVNGKGLITAASSSPIVINESDVTGLTTDLSNKVGTTLAPGNIFVGSAGSIATGRTLSLAASAGAFAVSNIGVLTMPNADTVTRGLLTNSDWNTFNNKQAALGFTAENNANKSVDINTDGTSDIKYPSVKAVKTYTDSLALGLNWQQPVELINVIDETSTPIVSPKNLDGYIISPGGNWTSVNPSFVPGDLLQYQAPTWVKIKSLVTGDRFAIAFKSTTTPSGPFVGRKNYRIQFDSTVNAGHYTYASTSPSNSDALFVQNANAYYHDVSFVYSTGLTAWVQLSASVSNVFGSGLTNLSGNIALGPLTADWNQTGNFAITTAGNINVNSGSLSTASTTANLFNTNASTLNIGGAANTINLGAAGATVRGVGALTLISGTGANLNIDSGTTGALNIGTSNDAKAVNIGTGNASNIINIGTSNVGTDTIAIGSVNDIFSLTSTGLNVSAGGALTGISSLNGAAFSSSSLFFAGAGTITSTGVNALTLDSGTTGALNLGTGNNAKVISIGTGNAGNTIDIGTNNTVADTIAIGSSLDLFSLSSSGLNVTTGGALSGVSALNGLSIASTSVAFAATGTVSSTGANSITLDSGTTGAVNIATGANVKTVNIATGGGGDTINIATNNTLADTIAIGSSLDSLSLSSSGFNVSTLGALSGVSTLNTISVSPTALAFAATGTITSGNGNALSLDSTATGSITIGTNANAKTITLGNGTGATSLALLAGTGNIDIGANAVARTINIGTAAGVIQNINLGGTGANVIGIGNTQTGGSIALGNAMTTGSISIGGTGAQTGSIDIGGGTGAQTVNLGTGNTGNKTINIGTGDAATNTINIGTNVLGVDVISIGTAADQLALQSSGLNVSTGGVITGVPSINTITLSSTTMTFAAGGAISSTGANALTLDSGTTGALNFGTNANAKTITLGNGTGATSLALLAGTGNIDIGANAVARTINIGTAAGVIQNINLGGTGANVIGIGNTQTGGSIALGNAMTTGSISIGGTGAQTGSIDIGGGTGAQTPNLGSGNTSAKTINIGTGNAGDTINIATNNTTPDTIVIGSANDTFSLFSTGLNIGTGGALTGVSSIDTILHSSTSTIFAGAGTITSTGANALTLDSGTTGALNLGTGNSAKTINLGTGTGGDSINIGTNNSASDTIAIGSALDSFTLTSSGLSITTLGALTGVTSIDTVTHSASAMTFAGAGTINSTGANPLTLDSGTTGAVNLATGNSSKFINIATGNAGNTVNIGTNNTATDTINIGSSLDALTITSSGVNISSTGALTGVTLLNSFVLGTSSIAFSADGAVTSGGTGVLTLDSGASGALNIGTGNNTKTINLGTGNAGDIINIGTNNTVADTISIGSPLDALALSSSGFNVSTAGALSGVSSLNTIAISPVAITFAATGSITTTDGFPLSLDSLTTGAINIGTGNNAKTITIGNGAGASALTLNAGTGNINIGANAVARTINVGTGAGVIENINLGGTGANVIGIGNTQAGGSVSIGAAMTSGSINIGGTGAQAGNIDIGVGTGVQVLNLGTGNTNSKTVNIGTGNATNTINVGTNNVAQDFINIGSSNDALAIVSSGLNVTSGGALTGVSSINTIAHTATNINFAGSGSLTTTGANTLTLDSGTTGLVNLGSGNNAKTINIGTGNAGDIINIGTNNTVADTIAIGSALDALSLSSTGLNVTTGGALTGVVSIDTISYSPTTMAFAATGTLSSTGATPLTIDSGTTGALNLGTGNNAKTINLGTGNAGDIINIGTNNTIADTISIGSALDALSLSSTGLNLTTSGALTGVTSIDTITYSATAMTFAGAGSLSSTGANTLTIDSGTTGAINIGTNANAKIITMGNSSGATDVIINAGTGGLDLGANAIAKTVSVGTTTGASRLNLGAGSGGIFINGLGASGSGHTVICIDSGTAQLFFGASQTSCNTSSLRYKHDIENITLGLDAVGKLRPVSYAYNSDNSKALGFIAEEVATVDERLVIRDDQGRPNAIDTDYFIPILTKGIQELDDKLNLFITNSGISLGALNQLVLSGGLKVEGEVDLGKDSVGEAVIRQGATEVSVSFTKQYDLMPIVTITKMTQGVLSDYYVDNVSRAGFTIKIVPNMQKDMRFSWHAFGSANGRRLFSNGTSEDINATSTSLISEQTTVTSPPFVVVSTHTTGTSTTVITTGTTTATEAATNTIVVANPATTSAPLIQAPINTSTNPAPAPPQAQTPTVATTTPTAPAPTPITAPTTPVTTPTPVLTPPEPTPTPAPAASPTPTAPTP